ncbi:MAG TPA: dTDP-4-dehydrorhamnose reductase [Mucilaginibacter sp.]|nr:dTDP-4-dehydrorhamnose reductase [Mucilaginibacter sp.]
MDNIVVFGASGQLGQCLKEIAAKKKVANIFFPAESEADILNTNALKGIFETYKPSYCINCAAYTAVDKAEDDIAKARAINKTGVENIANLCLAYGSILIHTSTDFVFKGDKPTPLTEEDVADPINVYGLTKLEGEQAVVNILKKYYIIRTSWLYSEHGNNFVKTMLRLGAERDELGIVADQVGTPTYAMDLAGCILDIMSSSKQAYGIYHYSNEGVSSWYDFAKAIFDISETKTKTRPLRTSEYPTRAVRPAYSVMDKSKIKLTFGLDIPYWRDSLITCIGKLKQ